VKIAFALAHVLIGSIWQFRQAYLSCFCLPAPFRRFCYFPRGGLSIGEAAEWKCFWPAGKPTVAAEIACAQERSPRSFTFGEQNRTGSEDTICQTVTQRSGIEGQGPEETEHLILISPFSRSSIADPQLLFPELKDQGRIREQGSGA